MRSTSHAIAIEQPTIGDTIDGRYTLIREIARGGVGAIYEAQHVYTGRAVALKLLHRHFVRDVDAQERLLREARALATVRHPGIVEVLDAGVSDVGVYMALDMLEGRTLDGILAVRRPSIADTIRIIRQVCEALSFCHARGVVHRDIKPSNLVLTRNELGHEVVKVIDFGIAAIPNDGSPVASRKLTRSGELVGTPEYMAPEQLLAKPDVDLRCDVYATAVTLFECLTGETPYVGSYPEIMMKVMTAEAPPSVATLLPGVPRGLEQVIAMALAKEPSRRTSDVLSFARMLEEATGVRGGATSLLGDFPARAGVRPPTPMASAQSDPGHAVVDSQVEQRRRFLRAPYVTPVRILESDGQMIDGRTEDVSEGGLLVLTARPLRDQRVRVRFALPITGQIVDAAATSRWVREARGRHAIGLELITPTLEVRDTIRRYVELMKVGG